MSTILDFLGSDHRACDDLFASAEAEVAQNKLGQRTQPVRAIRAGDGPSSGNGGRRAVSRHSKTDTGMRAGPTEVMRMEHAQMRDLLQEMARAVAAGNRDSYLGLSETLNMLMQQHNLKEENMLYPMSDRVLGADSESVIRAMEAGASRRSA